MRLTGHTAQTLAEALDVVEGTVNSWSSGRKPVPPYAWDEVARTHRALYYNDGILPDTHGPVAEAADILVRRGEHLKKTGLLTRPIR